LPGDGARSDTLCPACGHRLHLILVHGHGQCAHCRVVVVPCCTGAGSEADEDACVAGSEIDDRDLRAAFDAEGGATVTEESLVQVLHARTGAAPVEILRVLRQAAVRGRLRADAAASTWTWIGRT
jgi:hypothetical protein